MEGSNVDTPASKELLFCGGDEGNDLPLLDFTPIAISKKSLISAAEIVKFY
jgi:hypothetical protein